jgi:hypothetical protein
MLNHLPEAARLTVPDDLAEFFTDNGRALGAKEVTLYLVDHEQRVLVPLPRPGGTDRMPQAIDSTLAGLCYRRLEVQNSERGRRMWVPLLDGLERLGVLEFDLDGRDPPDEQLLQAFAAGVAEMVIVKDPYGDLLHKVRRRQPMTVAAEIAWNLLPPLTFGTDRLVISAVLAPAYDRGHRCDGTRARRRLAGHSGDRRVPQQPAAGPRPHRDHRRHRPHAAPAVLR